MAPLSYSISQRVVHWATALLIFFNLVFADGMEEWHHATRDGGSATADQVASANVHAYVGIAIAVLAVLRLLLLAIHGKPALPENEHPLAKLASAVTHGLLYLLLFLVPLSGIMAYYFGAGIAGEAHAEILTTLLWALLVLHIAAALVHKFYWKTDVMDRMTKGVRA